MEMKKKEISEAIRKAAEEALEGFRDGSLFFVDFEFRHAIPYQLDFHEWIADLEAYLDVDQTQLQGENLFETIKHYFPATDKTQLQNLIADPKSINEDESLEWRRSLYENDQDNADILVLIKLELACGEIGSAIICCYSNVPGGEYDLLEVFSSIEEGEKFLSKYCF